MKLKSINHNILDRAFLGSAVTVALMEFFQVGSSLIDGIVTSRMIGAQAMAAIGLAFPLFSIAAVLSGTLASGAVSLGSSEIGRGNYKGFSKIGSTVFILGAALSLVFTALLFAFSGPLTRLLGASGNSADLFEPTREYILGLSIGAPALVFAPVIAPVIQLDNDAKCVRVAYLLGTVTNVALDLAAAKTGMGTFGIGLASALSYYVNVIVLLLHFFRKERMLWLKFSFRGFNQLPLLALSGSNVTVKSFADALRPIIINNYIIFLGGTAAMTALSARNNVFNFAGVIGAGIAGAISITMGIVHAEKSREDVRYVGKYAHRITFIAVGIVAALCMILSSPAAAFLVGDNEEIRNMVVFAMFMMAGELVLDTLLSARISYLAVLFRMVGCNLLQFGLKFLAVIPSVLILGGIFGVYGVLSGTLAGYLVLLFAVYIVTAVREKKVKISVDDYLRLDSSFDIPPYDVIELDIRDSDDAALVSEQVQMFCRGHKLDTKKAYYSALALEETANLLFENNKSVKGLKVDVRLVVKDGDIILRIRDNGVLLYPFGEKQGNLTDDPVSHLGIKMVRKIAKDIRYFNTMRLNYIILRI